MRTEAEMVAYALEVQPALLPFVPELLADLDELGSDSELIVRVLSDLRLPPSAKVIDLGCGKGTVSIEIAEKLKLRVLGIDLFEPFIAHCQRAAAEAGVSDLCEFRHGNIARLAGGLEPADAVVFAALGDVLGPLDETMRVIRQFVKPGGLLVVSDPYVRDGGSTSFDGFDGYGSRLETIARLTAWGDVLVREVVEAVDEGEDEDDESLLIMRRAKEIAQRHPELKSDLLQFAKSQGEQNDYADENLVDAIWVIQRS